MELYRELLSRSRLSVISAASDSELDRIARIVSPSVRLHDRAELETLFGELLTAAGRNTSITPKTLDLIGHSTATSLLRLGSWVIDAASRCVTAFFRGLAEQDVLARLGIRAVRLLACNTASTEQGRATLSTLADVLGVEVFGTAHLLYDHHYDDRGFGEMWDFMLVSSRDLRSSMHTPAAASNARWPRTLDLDELPALPLRTAALPWPQRVATGTAVREILQLIRRNAGAPMPGLIATPSCELALPSATRGGAYHLMHVLFDGAFVRCFPDGDEVPGVVYPVDDAPQLDRIVGELPLLELTR